MTTLCSSPDGVSPAPPSSTSSLLSTSPNERVSTAISSEDDIHRSSLSGSISPSRYGHSRSRELDDVPFFTVARYRNPTAPTTYELAAVSPFGALESTPEAPEALPSIEDSENITSPSGAGEALYNGSLDLSPVSPVELAFGKVSECNGEWLGKSFDIPHSASFTSGFTPQPRERPFKDEVDWSVPVSAYHTSASVGNEGQDNTPVGCIHAASGSLTRLSEESTHQQVREQPKLRSFDDTPVRGCVSFMVPMSSKPPILRPKPSLRAKEKLPVKRRVSAPFPEVEVGMNPNNSRTLINHRNSIAVDYTESKPKVSEGRVPEVHGRRSASIEPPDTKNKLAKDNEPKKAEANGGDKKFAVYEDARVTDAAERLENVSPRSSNEHTPRTPRTPRNKSREPSFCLETESEKYPQTEAEYMALLHKKITEAHERQLFPLKEDLADWLMKLLGEEGLTPENLLSRLDNGVLVCRLASLISSKAQEAKDKGLSNLEVPRLPYRTWGRARSGTFFARDNISNFLRFCRRLGVHSNLLFETEDLVCGTGVRGVVLCLLEVGRLAQLWWNMEPPGLVKLERELDGEELSGRSDSGYSNASSPRDSTLALNPASSTPQQVIQQQTSKNSRPSSAPSQLPVPTKLNISSSPTKEGIPVLQEHSPTLQSSHFQASQPKTETRPKPSVSRGPKPIPPPKPASIKRAVSRITKRPTSFPSSRSYDRGWSGAKTTPTTPVSTPTHSKTRLPMAKTPRSSGRSTPNTTPTTPTQCRRYLVSMQKPSPNVISPKTSTPKVSAKSIPRTPSRSLSFCSRLQEALKAPRTESESKTFHSDLDNKVQDIADQTQGLCGCRYEACNKKHIKKLSDGRYDILGRNVLVRLLKGKHVMVRVGGGWDTLEHYLLRHDPTQVKMFKSRPNADSSFLHIRGHYRSPTPSEKSGGASSRGFSSRKSSPTCSEADRTQREDESLSRQSTPTEQSFTDDNQSTICEDPVESRRMDHRDSSKNKPLDVQSISSSTDTGMDEISSAFHSLESKIMANHSNRQQSKSTLDDSAVLSFSGCSSHHCRREGRGSCDLLSAPMGEHGDFRTPASLSSNPMDNIMVASCPSLDLTESSPCFSTPRNDGESNLVAEDISTSDMDLVSEKDSSHSIQNETF